MHISDNTAGRYSPNACTLFLVPVSPTDDKPEGWCEVICVLPGLKVKREFSMTKKKFIKLPVSKNYKCKFSAR